MTAREQERIDNYLSGRMSPEERNAFEQEKDGDAELSRQVAVQQEAIAVVDAMGDEIVRERIRKAGARSIASKGEHKKHKNVWWILALLLLGMLAGLFYFSQEKELPPANPGVIYAANFETAPLSFGDRGSAELLTAASIAYADENYSKALQLFETAAPNNEDAKVGLAKGICLLKLNQFAKANQVFASFVEDPLYGEQCRWYLALGSLKTNDLSEAKAQLEALNQSGASFKKEETKQILKTLD